MIQRALAIVAFAFFITSPVNAAAANLIAVAAEGKTPAADVSKAAARSPYFLIFDGRGVFIESVDNPYKAAQKRTSASVVPFLAQKGVTMIVAGRFGENMIRAMKRHGMEAMRFQGSTEKAIQRAVQKRGQI